MCCWWVIRQQILFGVFAQVFRRDCASELALRLRGKQFPMSLLILPHHPQVALIFSTFMSRCHAVLGDLWLEYFETSTPRCSKQHTQQIYSQRMTVWRPLWTQRPRNSGKQWIEGERPRSRDVRLISRIAAWKCICKWITLQPLIPKKAKFSVVGQRWLFDIPEPLSSKGTLP